MSVYKRTPSAQFYDFDFQWRGHRFLGSTGCVDKRSAETFERRERERVKSVAATLAPTASMSFDTAADRYWLEVGRHAKEHDLEANLARLVEMVGPETPLSSINGDMLARLVARRRGEPKLNPKGGVVKDKKTGNIVLVSPARVNRSVTQLIRRIHTRARRAWEIPLSEPIWADHMLKEPKARVREMTFAEEARIEAVERIDYRPIRKFLMITGMRRRGAVDLEWAQVDWGAGVIHYIKKGGEDGEIPLTPELVALLWPLRDHHEVHVFTFVAERTRIWKKTGKVFKKGSRYPITYEGLGTDFRRTLNAAGVEDYRLHDNRHTAATRTLRGSKNLAAVQELLGHADISTTRKYAHVIKDDLAEAMGARRVDEDRRRAEYEEREKSRENPANDGGTTSKLFREKRKIA